MERGGAHGRGGRGGGRGRGRGRGGRGGYAGSYADFTHAPAHPPPHFAQPYSSATMQADSPMFPLYTHDTSSFQLPTGAPPAAAAHPQRPTRPPRVTHPAAAHPHHRPASASAHPHVSHKSQRAPRRGGRSQGPFADADDYAEELYGGFSTGPLEVDSDASESDDSWDAFDDIPVEDEATIFDLAEAAFVDEQQQRAARANRPRTAAAAKSSGRGPVHELAGDAAHSARRSLKVVTKKERQAMMAMQHQQQQLQQHQQQPHMVAASHSYHFQHTAVAQHAPMPKGKAKRGGSNLNADASVFIPAQPAPNDGLTHSERRKQRREEKQALAAAEQAHMHPSGKPAFKQPKQKNSNTFDGQPINPYRQAMPQQVSHQQQGGMPQQQAPHRNNQISSPYRSAPNVFPPHLPAETMRVGLAQGVYFSGVLRVVGSNAFVTVAGLPRDVFIDGRKARNRALDGDVVAVQIVGHGNGVIAPQHNNEQANGKQSARKSHAHDKKSALVASLDSLIHQAEQAEEEKMQAERAAKAGKPIGKQSAQNNGAVSSSSAPAAASTATPANPVAHEDDEKPLPSSRTPAAMAALAELAAALPATEQHKGEVVGILQHKFSPLRAPGLLKPFSDTLALFVPLDKKTPFALIPQRFWPPVFADAYRAYLAEKKARKEAIKRAKQDKRKKGNFPFSDGNSSAIVEDEMPLAGEERKQEPEVEAETEPTPSPEDELDPMSAAASPNSIVLDAHVYVAQYMPWQSTERQPFATIARDGSGDLGLSGDIRTETEALLVANGVDYDHDGAFPQSVLDEVAKYGADWQIPADEIARRRDLRDQTKWRIVSIDPTTARDLDDAVHVLDCGDGTVEIGVHIADVSHFVKPGTQLDEQARHRATTIYLVQRAIPMLPPILCEQLCSLNPNVDRLAYSCIFYLDKTTGRIAERKPWFGRTVIRTCARLNYETAQLLMEFDKTPLGGREEVREEDLTGELAAAMARGSPYRPSDTVSIAQLLDDMQLIHRVLMLRRADRFREGSLTLSNVKLQFALDADKNPTGFYTYVIRDSNRIIEEAMLLANMLVAQQCVLFAKNVSLLRRHPPPNDKAMSRVSQACAELGFAIDASSSGALQHSLESYESTLVGRVHGVNDESIEAGSVPLRQVLEPLCTKPMQLAQYFSVGSMPDEPKAWEHYALHFSHYTHFTSPIRRYADVIVHRVLSYSLELEAWRAQLTALDADSSQAAKLRSHRPRPPARITPELVADIADHCNVRKANAKKAQETSSKIYLCDFLLRHHSQSPLSAQAVLVDMICTQGHADPTFEILLPQLGVQKQMHLSDLIAEGRVRSADIEPKDPPNERLQQRNNNNQGNNRQARRQEKQANGAEQKDTAAASSSSPPPAASATSQVAAPKSAKRLTIEWADGTRNVYSIFDAIDVELIVQRGPPMEVDARVIAPSVARTRAQQQQVEQQAKQLDAGHDSPRNQLSPSPDSEFYHSPEPNNEE